MDEEANETGVIHPAIPSSGEAERKLAVGDEQYAELKKQVKLEAAIDFAIAAKIVTTYKPVGLASGFFWRDQKFHFALGEISKLSIGSGGAAKSAVVTRADNSGEATRPGRQFYTMLEEARPKLKIKHLANGEYDPIECEKLWLSEMDRLGFDVTKLPPQSNTYYAVLHGEPGNQTFAAMRRKPGASQLVFKFDGPAFADDASLAGHFAERFLPLKIMFLENGTWTPTIETFTDFNEARDLASVLTRHYDDVRIATKDGREISPRRQTAAAKT